MSIAQSDIFAPVLSILPYQTLEQAAAMHEQCPYALTAAIFGPVKQAAALQRTITAGTVVLNDLIVSTADPRVPFSGRRRSGFGATRGRGRPARHDGAARGRAAAQPQPCSISTHRRRARSFVCRLPPGGARAKLAHAARRPPRHGQSPARAQARGAKSVCGEALRFKQGSSHPCPAKTGKVNTRAGRIRTVPEASHRALQGKLGESRCVSQ